jgi:hypothetical protein
MPCAAVLPRPLLHGSHGHENDVMAKPVCRSKCIPGITWGWCATLRQPIHVMHPHHSAGCITQSCCHVQASQPGRVFAEHHVQLALTHSHSLHRQLYNWVDH